MAQNTENENIWAEPLPYKVNKPVLIDPEDEKIAWRDAVFIFMMVILVVGVGANAFQI